MRSPTPNFDQVTPPHLQVLSLLPPNLSSFPLSYIRKYSVAFPHLQASCKPLAPTSVRLPLGKLFIIIIFFLHFYVLYLSIILEKKLF